MISIKLLSFLLILFFGSSDGSKNNDDPCLGTPCGKGAKCQTMMTIAVCICPDDTDGDPFVECRTRSVPKVNQDHNPSIILHHLSNPSPSPRPSASATSTISSNYRNSQYPYSSTNTNENTKNVEPSRYTPHVPVDIQSNSNQNQNQFNKYEPQYKDQQTKNYMPNSIVKDPHGRYSNCKEINKMVVCADSNDQPSAAVDEQSHYRHDNNNREIMNTYDPMPKPNNVYGEIQRNVEFNRPSANHNYKNSNSNHHHHNNRDPELRFINSNNDFNRFEKPHHRDTIQPHHRNEHQNQNQDPMCRKFCGEGSVCRLHLDRPICGCPAETTGDPSIRCTPIHPPEEDNQRQNPQSHSRFGDHSGNTMNNRNFDDSPPKNNHKMGKNCIGHDDCLVAEICYQMQCVNPRTIVF